MFKKWKNKRILKNMQEECFHTYYVCNEYETWSDYWEEYRSTYDLFCPECEKIIYKLNTIDKNRIINKQEITTKHYQGNI